MATAGPSALAVAVQRPNTKRKRKFKRMAVDPNAASAGASAATGGASSSAPDASAMDVMAAAAAANSAGKRPKVRNR